MFEKAKNFIRKYRHAWVLLYALIYMPWFLWLENHVRNDYYLIHSPLDDYIPFVEYFIIPYFMWFIYIAVTAAYFFFTDRKGFYRFCAFIFSGMTIFLIICTIFPTVWRSVRTPFPGIMCLPIWYSGCTRQTRPQTCSPVSTSSTLSARLLPSGTVTPSRKRSGYNRQPIF